MIKKKETEPENWRYLMQEGVRENIIKRQRGAERKSREPEAGPLNRTVEEEGLYTMCPQSVQQGNPRSQTPKTCRETRPSTK